MPFLGAVTTLRQAGASIHCLPGKAEVSDSFNEPTVPWEISSLFTRFRALAAAVTKINCGIKGLAWEPLIAASLMNSAGMRYQGTSVFFTRLCRTPGRGVVCLHISTQEGPLSMLHHWMWLWQDFGVLFRVIPGPASPSDTLGPLLHTPLLHLREEDLG